jgi:hypothetical protein
MTDLKTGRRLAPGPWRAAARDLSHGGGVVTPARGDLERGRTMTPQTHRRIDQASTAIEAAVVAPLLLLLWITTR